MGGTCSTRGTPHEILNLPLSITDLGLCMQAGGEMITNLLESCSPIYNITVLGETGSYFGHITKMMLMIRTLHKLDPHQLVMFLDADLR